MNAEGMEGRRCLRAAGPLVVFAVVLAGCGGGTAARPQEPTLQAPITAHYTTEQADRGERLFASICSVCHGRTEFTGPIFRLTWMADPVGNLFGYVTEAMPQDRPGILSPEEYAAILAYVLRLNRLTAGDRELPADTELLSTMRW